MIMPGLALAHGPTRQKHTETIEINATPAEVWKRIENFNDLSWNPLVAKTEGEAGNKVDQTRTATLKSGGTLTESLYKYDAAKMMYATLLPQVDVKVLPVTNYSSYLTVKPLEGGKRAQVEWRSAFYRGYPNNDPPPELNEEAAIKAVQAFSHAALEGLKQAVESGS
ncbi:SRPBCC family protein [Mangrovicella endophytica]|uniref:SRPBCC family protein n=1 Tax=Mangrovicella endophytica TaxID=2066697 RepID=UPI000C9E457F|nr:SRPBCC family protein [Mangrovicella endophytica]